MTTQSDIQPGQFWRDTQIGDILKVLDMRLETPILTVMVPVPPRDGVEQQPVPVPTVGDPVLYVKCACIANHQFFGIQEMKASHLDTDRFQRVGRLKSLWYAFRWRKAKLTAQAVPKFPDHLGRQQY